MGDAAHMRMGESCRLKSRRPPAIHLLGHAVYLNPCNDSCNGLHTDVQAEQRLACRAVQWLQAPTSAKSSSEQLYRLAWVLVYLIHVAQAQQKLAVVCSGMVGQAALPEGEHCREGAMAQAHRHWQPGNTQGCQRLICVRGCVCKSLLQRHLQLPSY